MRVSNKISVGIFALLIGITTAAQENQDNQSNSSNEQSAPMQSSNEKITTDPAPSGTERSEMLTGAKTGSSVTIPGKDAPVYSEKKGNTEKLDFDTRDQPASESDTTIHVDPEKK